MSKMKRVLHVICFACVMLIDWSRGAAEWVYWATIINLVGVVMAIVMGSQFTWKKQSLKKYIIWCVICLLGSAIGYVVWQQNPGATFLTQYVTAVLGILSLGIVALRIWSERFEMQNATMGHPLLVAIFVIMSILMVCSRLGEIWQLYYLVIFGMFYLIPLKEEEKEDFWLSLADGCIVGFFVIQIWAYGFRPYDEIRYKGAYSNTNMNALFYLVTYIMVLFRLHYMWYKREQSGRKATTLFSIFRVLFYLLAAGLCGFMVMTMTRTALLVGAAVTIVFAIYEFFVFRRIQLEKVLLQCVTYGVCIVILFPCVFATVRYLPTILHHPVWWEGEYSQEKVHSYDGYNSEKYVEFDEFMQNMMLRMFGVNIEAKRQQSSNVQELQDKPAVCAVLPVGVGSGNIRLTAMLGVAAAEELLTGEAADSGMHIRLAIYKKYLSNLNYVGHELDEGYFQITEHYHAWHGQNVFIQVLFYYGIPAGICFILLMVILGIQYLRMALRNKRVEIILALLVWLVFIGYGMLESVWYMGQSILFLMYLVPKILIDNRK